MQTTAPGKQTSRSRRLKIGLLVLPAVVVLAILGKTYLISPLPTGAYRVLSTANWTGLSRVNLAPHQWLPNGDLAYLRTDANGMQQVCYQKMDDKGPIGAVRRGPELPLTAWFDTFFPSPDEQWVAYMQFTNPRSFQTFLLSADGKTTRKGGEYFSGWLADSRSYLSLISSQNYVTKIYHLDGTQTETIPKTAAGDLPTQVTTVAGRTFLMGSHFYNPEQYPGALAQNYPLMTMRSFAMAHPTVVQETWQAKVPAGMTFGTAYPSPDNKHLLWVVGKQRATPWSDWLGQVNVRWHKDPTFDMHYFVSDLHGNNVHPVLTNVMGGTSNWNPVWTPDSKHLSFLYKDQLYFVPVE
ncbi:MAG: hypothetical protein JWL77_4041 [Chthonomonadaceae bacterium]|nr:hypothetical protein [Chthonomonadaceae bacterium]